MSDILQRLLQTMSKDCCGHFPETATDILQRLLQRLLCYGHPPETDVEILQRLLQRLLRINSLHFCELSYCAVHFSPLGPSGLR